MIVFGMKKKKDDSREIFWITIFGTCDLMISFKKGTSKLDHEKIIQILMDGPNVNWKSHHDYVTEREASNPDSTSLIEIRSCALHFVHGSYRTAMDGTGWKLDSLLKSLWYLFNESPARREDY